jgi:predicted HicB family RNase H-like nuclease
MSKISKLVQRFKSKPKDFTYKEFIGSVHFNADDEVFYGKIEGIDDLIVFEGDTVNELKQAFQDSVEDYIASCKKHDKTIDKEI